jgi:acyl-CoA synthetase (NDP forming)/GNAT superfamily N-acetyltransferase
MAAVDARAADGSYVRIRPVVPGDREALYALHERASERSRTQRFFSVGADPGHRFVDRLLGPVGVDWGALLVEHREETVALGVFVPTAPEEAEVAFLVADDHQGKGLGTLLLEHLASVARARGILRFRADVLSTNRDMLTVFADSGFAERAALSGPVTGILMDTDLGAEALARQAERERQATARSLDPLLTPRQVAVVGCGRTEGPGYDVLRNLIDDGYTGRIYPVNPRADVICSLRAFPSVSAIGEPVDLAVIAVPAAVLRDAIVDCAAAGVRAAVILTAGLAEVGDAGRTLQRELVAIARRHGMRLVGPNCLGIVNTAPEIRLNATFGIAAPPAGGLCLASQSGAVGIAVLDGAGRQGPGIAEFVSLGNKADLSGNDLLLHWWRDPRAEVIGLYLESFGNPRRFVRIARLVATDKPVLIVKGGLSVGGARAGASHTAAAATPQRVLDAVVASSGVIRLDSLPEMLDVARVLAGRPLPRGNRLAVIGNAGGGGILAADAAAAAGLEVPELTPSTVEKILARAPRASAVNPIDLGATATALTLEESVRVVAASGEVDMIVAVVAATRSNDIAAAVRAVEAAAADHPEVPLVAVALGAAERLAAPADSRLPVFDFPEPAVAALGHVARYAAWRRRPLGTVPQFPDADVARARAVLDTYLHDHPEGGWLPTVRGAEILDALGIPMAATRAVADPVAAVAAAEEFGYPVVLKTAAPGVVHKTDRGGVRTGLRTPEEVSTGHAQVHAATGDPRVLIQRQVSGVEMLIGAVRDPSFGPMIVAGTGGVLTDLVDDRACRALPLTDADAAELLDGLRGRRLLAGYRGAPPADVGALRDVLHRVALLAERLPEVVELDLNPVMVGTEGASVVDVRIRVAPQ